MLRGPDNFVSAGWYIRIIVRPADATAARPFFSLSDVRENIP